MVHEFYFQRTNRRLAGMVAGVHLLVVVLLLLVAWIQPPEPVEEVLDVQLASLPSPAAGAAPPAVAPPEPEPEPEPVRAPPPPEPEPAPPPPPEPEPVRAPPPPEPEPAPAPAPREEPRPEWRARTAEEIRRSMQEQPQPEPRRESPPPRRTTTPSRPVVDAGELSRNLANQIDTAVDVGTPVSSTTETEYTDLVKARLTQLWQQPSEAETRRQRPRASVTLTIQRDGSVTIRRLSRPSGNAAMDASVRRMLGAIDRLPPLPDDLRRQNLTLTLDLQLLP